MPPKVLKASDMVAAGIPKKLAKITADKRLDIFWRSYRGVEMVVNSSLCLRILKRVRSSYTVTLPFSAGGSNKYGSVFGYTSLITFKNILVKHVSKELMVKTKGNRSNLHKKDERT